MPDTTYYEGTSTGVWDTWVTSSDSSSTTVWRVWAGSTNPSSGTVQATQVASSAQEITPEQAEARRAAVERQRQRDEEARQQARLMRDRADERAEELLVAFLNDEQREQLAQQSAFIVETEERRFRINRGRSMNVHELNKDGRVVAKLCAHPVDYVPNADTMLAQKIMLENDLQGFLAVANRREVIY